MGARVIDRRKRPRISLRWPARVKRPRDVQAVQAETVNVTCGGIYCVCGEPFREGETLEFALLVPAELDQERGSLQLCGHAVVVRSEPVDPVGWGIAFVIEDYALARAPSGRFGESLERSVDGAWRHIDAHEGFAKP